MELFLKFEAKTKLSSISWEDACYEEYCYAAPPRKLLPRACCSSWAYGFFSACCSPGHAPPLGMLLPLVMILSPQA